MKYYSKLILPLFLLLISTFSKAQVRYNSVLESGVFSEIDNNLGENLNFSINTSQGISYRNTFIGIGISYDRYERFTLLPLYLDLRYSFAGQTFSKGEDSFFDDNSSKGGFGMYFFANIGQSGIISVNEYDSFEGLVIHSGLGFAFGTKQSIPFTISLGYKLQELTESLQVVQAIENLPIEMFVLKIGIIFKG